MRYIYICKHCSREFDNRQIADVHEAFHGLQKAAEQAAEGFRRLAAAMPKPVAPEAEEE